MSDHLAAMLDGAPMVERSDTGLVLAWFGGHGLHVYSVAGTEIDYCSVGDFAEDEASREELLAAVQDYLCGEAWASTSATKTSLISAPAPTVGTLARSRTSSATTSCAVSAPSWPSTRSTEFRHPSVRSSTDSLTPQARDLRLSYAREAIVKLLGYTRISSEGQLDGFGLDAQEAAIRSWVNGAGHTLHRLVSDIGVSGATDAVDRPGLSDVLLGLANREADGLVVARLDRLARALTVQEATLAVIWRSGGQVFTADAGRVMSDDPDNPMRTALRQVVGVFAELDRRMVVKRLRDGRSAKAATGRKSVGSYPYGYTGHGNGRERDHSPVRPEQEVIQLVVAARESGHTYRQIAAELDAQGYAPRRAKLWSPMTVRSIFKAHFMRTSRGEATWAS